MRVTERQNKARNASPDVTSARVARSYDALSLYCGLRHGRIESVPRHLFLFLEKYARGGTPLCGLAVLRAQFVIYNGEIVFQIYASLRFTVLHAQAARDAG